MSEKIDSNEGNQPSKMNDKTIELFYVSDYEDPQTGEVTKQIEGVSIISREDFLMYLVETEWEPCECQIQGCLSCFLDEKRAWADGYGSNCTTLWFGNDPATGKQWDPEAVLAERRNQGVHECQYCYEDVAGKDSEVWEGGHYHPYCLEEMQSNSNEDI